VRAIPNARVAAELRLPRQSWNDWANLPDEPLQDWTGGLRDRVSLSAVDGDWSGDVYAPELAKPRAFQYARWVPIDRFRGDGLRLIRLRLPRGQLRYHWGACSAGTLTEAADLDLEPLQRRRLLYGLDMAAGNPTAVSLRGAGDAVEIVLRSALPASEERVCAALGQLLSAREDSYYPRVWRVPRTDEGVVRQMLTRLGIEVVAE
jgi:hypothetical protein